MGSATGGLVTTAWDFAKIAQLFLNNGEYGGQRFLRPETVAEATSVQTECSHLYVDYRHHHMHVVEWLERHGARRGTSPDSVDQDGRRPPAVRPSSDAESSAIVELIYAASEGDRRAVQRMVARGIDLGSADYDHRTPLHLAAAEGHEHVVQYFVDHGVDLSPRDRWGGTPLADARRHGHERVRQLLESCGATA